MNDSGFDWIMVLMILLKLVYIRITRSIPWLLMPWILVLPFNIYDKLALVFYNEWFKLPTPSQYWEISCGYRVNSVYLGQYHGCWSPGSFSRQVISSHDIDYTKYLGPSLNWGSVLSTCVKSMWNNDIKCKYMFMFLQLKFQSHLPGANE